MTMQTTHTHPTSPQAPVVLLTGFAPFEHETRNPIPRTRDEGRIFDVTRP